MSTTSRRRAPRPDELVRAALGLALTAVVLFGTLAPGVPSASHQTASPDRWTGGYADPALAPTPTSGIVQTWRARPWSRAATTVHGLCTNFAPLSAQKAGAVAPAVPPGLLQAMPNLLRRRGPPQSTS